MAELTNERYTCTRCRTNFVGYHESCPQCGLPRNQMGYHPGVAAVLSFIFPGAGQIYKGHFVSGFAFFIIFALFLVLAAVYFWALAFVSLLFWINAVYDAHHNRS